jgi:hypothetical protein
MSQVLPGKITDCLYDVISLFYLCDKKFPAFVVLERPFPCSHTAVIDTLFCGALIHAFKLKYSVFVLLLCLCVGYPNFIFPQDIFNIAPVTDDPGSNPDQKYARRRERQIKFGRIK